MKRARQQQVLVIEDEGQGIIADLEQAILGQTEPMIRLLEMGDHKKPGLYWNIDDFIFKNGVFFDRPWGKQGRFRMGKKQACFGNAAKLALDWLDDGIRYCEGYAHQRFLPTLHGWLIDDSGQVIEVTPGWEEPAAYFGVVFKTEFVRETALRRQIWGVLDDPGGGFPLLKGSVNVSDVIEPGWMVNKRGKEFYGY